MKKKERKVKTIYSVVKNNPIKWHAKTENYLDPPNSYNLCKNKFINTATSKMVNIQYCKKCSAYIVRKMDRFVRLGSIFPDHKQTSE